MGNLPCLHRKAPKELERPSIRKQREAARVESDAERSISEQVLKVPIKMQRRGSLHSGQTIRFGLFAVEGVLQKENGESGVWVVKVASSKMSVPVDAEDIAVSLPDDDLLDDLETLASEDESESYSVVSSSLHTIATSSDSYNTAIQDQ
ncbi:hypothetical protein DIPPA_70167 [Diplonema papillatum]|nr:hypothetical protein DIPPA_70167 [Diplonema papillatum]